MANENVYISRPKKNKTTARIKRIENNTTLKFLRLFVGFILLMFISHFKYKWFSNVSEGVVKLVGYKVDQVGCVFWIFMFVKLTAVVAKDKQFDRTFQCIRASGKTS